VGRKLEVGNRGGLGPNKGQRVLLSSCDDGGKGELDG
jgi:hypothetical protein